ncbi:hypothetical protein BESB_001370 [Besnoitia besnoiti]|uniref:Uncharacterized protein n=1 Tax=Besnoitia besnoiti TaxID=94643 RepID=A0A2A9MII6_BESBE|nr:hypothetical protein BESB_001370 [Besnoitia besnoiti]PFH37795.1 hypothetical protein BESB_001370 [Besnoitia besnoiti]
MDVVHSENLFPAEEKAKRRSLSSTFREECTTVSEEDVLFAGEGRDDCLETPEREEALPFEQRDENKENNCQDGENNCQSNYQDNCQSGSGLAAPPDSPTLSGAQPVGIPELAKPQKQTRLSNFFSFVVKPAAPTQPSAGGAKAEKEKPGSSQEKRTKKIDASKAAQNKLPFIAEQAARREAVEASTPPSTSSVPCASAPSALVLLPLCASHTPAAESFVSPSSSFVSAEACAAADAGGKTGRGDAALRSDEVSEGQPSSCVGSAEAQETDTLEVSAAEATDEAERPAAREERGSRGELEGTAVGAELPTERGERREERTQLEATQHTRGREGADDCGAEGYEQTPPSLSAERAASDPDEALMHASPARRTSLRLAASAVPASPSTAPVSPTPPCAASASPASPSSLSSSRCLSSSPSDSERAAAASQPASLLPALDAAAAEDARAIALEEVEGEDACGREPGEKENDDDCILEREDTDKTRGRGSAALREAWSAIFRRSSKQGDGEARDNLTSPSEEPKRRQSSSAVKRETGRERLHSREKEGEAIAPSAPVEAEAEAKQELENKPTPRVERGGRGGRRARGRRSTDALGILPVPAQRKGEERGNTPVEDSERREEPVEEAGRRRSKRVLECQQRRPLSDAEPVAVSVSESEEEERKAGNSEAEEAEDEAKQKRRCSARSLLPGAFPSTTSGVRGKRGRPKKRARVEAVPKQKDEKWDFFASKEERRQRQEEEARKRRQQEAERKKQEEEERRQREAFEAMMQRRRVILQEQQMQREREDEQRVRLLVERNAAWLASLKAFEEADALDERPQHRFPDIAAPKSLETHGVQADVRASRLEEDLLRQKSAARRVERSDAEGGEAEVAPRGTERKRRRCVAFSDEEADERVEPVVATGEAPRNEEEEEAAQRSADGRREGTAASREAPSVAAAAAQGKRFSPSSLRAAHAPPPQLAACGWAEVREKFLQLCGLAGFRARDATFFVADGPFTFYTRKGILNLLQKAGEVLYACERSTTLRWR